LSNISCLRLCQMFYRGQLCELYFQILDHKQSRRPSPQISHQLYATGLGSGSDSACRLYSLCRQRHWRYAHARPRRQLVIISRSQDLLLAIFTFPLLFSFAVASLWIIVRRSLTLSHSLTQIENFHKTLMKVSAKS